MLQLAELLPFLSQNALEADERPIWPAQSWQALGQAGVLRWAIPANLGGLGISPRDLLDGYEALASACLTTTFILSQRDAACRRLRDNPNALAAEVLDSLAKGGCFATVGLSQLTTSRQHGRPALLAKLVPAGVVFDGAIPWVTGAPQADFFVIGGVLDDRRQVMALLPRGSPGLTIGQPFQLAALEGSLTAELHCTSVFVEDRHLLAGPQEKVIVAGKGGTGSLETSCLALGLAGAAIDYLHREAASRPELAQGADRLEQSRQRLRADMHALAEGTGTPDAATGIRQLQRRMLT